MLNSLESLSVVGVCECGCRSIYFTPIDRNDARIANGVGQTADGKFVDVMVWAKDDVVTALDIVDYESSGQLPTSESICSYDEAGKRRL